MSSTTFGNTRVTITFGSVRSTNLKTFDVEEKKRKPAGVVPSLTFWTSLLSSRGGFLLLPNVATLQEKNCDSSAAASGDIATIILI